MSGGINMKEHNEIQILFKPGKEQGQQATVMFQYLLCPDPQRTHYLDENAALLLQAAQIKKHNQIRQIEKNITRHMDICKLSQQKYTNSNAHTHSWLSLLLFSFSCLKSSAGCPPQNHRK